MPSKLVEKTMRTKRLPHIWCPGCGHGILMRDVCQAIDNLGLEKEKVCTFSYMLSRRLQANPDEAFAAYFPAKMPKTRLRKAMANMTPP